MAVGTVTTMSKPAGCPSWPEAPQPQQRSCLSTAGNAQVCRAPAAIPVGASDEMRVASRASTDEPLPSWPLPFAPQQNSARAPPTSSAVAQVCAPPAASAVTCARPGTCAGVARTVLPPIASWPKWLSPQQ